ncbi:MAG: DUF4112 domain-containing protein [Pseudomonadota bacterium]
MPSTSSPDAKVDAEARRRRVERLHRLAERLDARFTLPGLGIPIGWDSILGLIPGVGDIITAAPGILMMAEARRIGARKRAMARMAFNTGFDMVLGGVPVIGDVFDLFYKSHRRNSAILETELTRIETQEKETGTWQTAKDQKTDHATPTRF